MLDVSEEFNHHFNPLLLLEMQTVHCFCIRLSPVRDPPLDTLQDPTAFFPLHPLTSQTRIFRKGNRSINLCEESLMRNNLCVHQIFRFTTTGWPRSYRKYILQITQPSQYRCAKLQYMFAVNSGSPSRSPTGHRKKNHRFQTILGDLKLIAKNVSCFKSTILMKIDKTSGIFA